MHRILRPHPSKFQPGAVTYAYLLSGLYTVFSSANWITGRWSSVFDHGATDCTDLRFRWLTASGFNVDHEQPLRPSFTEWLTVDLFGFGRTWLMWDFVANRPALRLQSSSRITCPFPLVRQAQMYEKCRCSERLFVGLLDWNSSPVYCGLT